MTLQAPPTPAPAPVPAPSNRANVAIRFFLGLAVVSFVAGVAVLAVSQDDEPYSATDAPENVLRQYLTAFSRGDCERVAELSTERSLDADRVDPSENVDWCQALPAASGIIADNVEIESIETLSMTSDYATVEFSFSVVGFPAEDNMAYLSRDNGEWKIDSTSLGNTGGLGIPGS